MYAVWLAVIIISVIAEAATTQLISIWFVGSAIFALIASIFTDYFAIQIIVFISTSILMLIFARPLLKRIMDFKKEHTNVDRYLGEHAVVISEINNQSGTGQVNVSGKCWSAKSIDDNIIKKGEHVRIESIEGVKLVVIKK